jgi:hypothetical protein
MRYEMNKYILIIIALFSISVSSQVLRGIHTSASCCTAHCDSDCCSEMEPSEALLPVSANNCPTLPVCCIRDHSNYITEVNQFQSFKTCKNIIKYKVIEYNSFQYSNGKRLLCDLIAEQPFLFSSNSIPLRI